MSDNMDDLNLLQEICDACLTVSDRMDLTAHELIVAVAANLGRFVAVAHEENPDVPLADLRQLALDVFEEGINAGPAN